MEHDAHYTWTAFTYWMKEKHPDVELTPRGSLDELLGLFERIDGLKRELIEHIKGAKGDVARTIYWAVTDGWFPKDEAVNAIRDCKDDKSIVIYMAAKDGWYPKDKAMRHIRSSVGDLNRDLAVQMAYRDGWFPIGEAKKTIRDYRYVRQFSLRLEYLREKGVLA